MNLNQTYRNFVLAIAQNPQVRQLVTTRGRRFSRRFVAGDTPAEALQALEVLEQQGVHAILDLLGEMVTSQAMAQQFTQQIIAMVRSLGHKPYPRYLSVKPTQVGLDLGLDLATSQMSEILAEAQQVDCFVRLDMEDHPRVEATLELYRRLHSQGYRNVGIVLQSYLRRTPTDLAALLPLLPNVRIVKGAYKEPPEVAYHDKATIDTQYLELCRTALSNGLYTAVASHDPQIIQSIKNYTHERGISADKFEFQMLYGVRRDEQKKLAAEGYTVRAYVPYGTDWYPYLSRRIAEKPENFLFVARSLIQG